MSDERVMDAESLAAYQRQIVRLTKERNEARSELDAAKRSWARQAQGMRAQIGEGTSAKAEALSRELRHARQEVDRLGRALAEKRRTESAIAVHAATTDEAPAPTPDEYEPPSQEEWQKVQAALRRNNHENRVLRLWARAVRAYGIDINALDDIVSAHRAAEVQLAAAEAGHSRVAGDLASATAAEKGRFARELAVAAELVEMRRRELQMLEVLMREVPASAQHRGRQSHRPIPQMGGLV